MVVLPLQLIYPDVLSCVQNDSIKLELSDLQTPDCNGPQSTQLSAILAPNSILYGGDLDNIIDNDEDVQVDLRVV